MIFESTANKIIFYKFPIILFLLIPFFLITGPFMSDLSISLISLLFLILCFKRKNFSYFKNKFFYFFLIFWFYLLFNSIIINFNLESLKISFFYIRYGIFVIAVTFFFDKDYKVINYFFFSILICFVSLILDGFYQYFTGKNILGFEQINNYRVSSFFDDEFIMGSYLSRLWPIFFGLSIYFAKGKKKLFYLVIFVFIFSEALIFLSGDRTSFFYINLTAIFIIILSNKLYKLRLLTLSLSIILIVIISFINPAAKDRVINKTLKQSNLTKKLNINSNKDELNNNNNNAKVYIFSKHHTEIYTSAYKMFLDNKFFGVGVKNYRNFCGDEKYKIGKQSCSTHPHNTYLQVLTELGLFGFIFLIYIFFYFFYFVLKHMFLKFKKKYHYNDFQICILSGILIYLWPLAPTGSIFNNWLNIISILNLPFLFWSLKMNKFNKN